MELGEVVRRRRMVRSFSGRVPPPEVLDTLLGLMCRSPSAGNTGGWDAVVLQGDDTSTFWEATTTPEWRARARRFPELSAAPVVVVLLVDPGAYLARYAEPDKASSGLVDVSDWVIPYWFVDVGMAAMTLLLAACDHRLAACFLGNFRGEPELLEALGVPDGRRYAGAVLLGEPGADDPASASLLRGPRDPQVVLHHGRW